jgi:NADH-quinone oxidoreductase subunit J
MPTLNQIIFWFFAFTAVASGIVMITRQKPMQSAIAFLVTLLSLAGLYLLLDAQFVAILQIIIYAGAILVLILFVIMLLHSHSGEGPTSKVPLQRPVAILLSLILFGGSIYLFASTDLGVASTPPSDMGTAQNVGHTLFDKFILPFEVASILLLAGLIGAVVLAKREREDSSSDAH